MTALGGAPPLPKFLQIEPVGQCNLRCQMCPIQFRRDGPPYGPPAFMPFDTFQRLLDQFEGLEELHLQGLGEPMMHPRFFDMVEHATTRDIRVSTNSNCTLLTAGRAERCVVSGLQDLHISLDGATAETYERIRVRSRFRRVLDNLHGLIEAKHRLGSETPHLHVVMVVMRQNLDELPDLVRLAAGLSIEDIFVQHLCHDFGESTLPTYYRPMHEFVSRQTLLGEDLDRVETYFEVARSVAAEAGINLRLPRARPRPSRAEGRDRCSWPWTGAYVSYQGLAMPCCMVATPDRINFGSMAERGVRDVWESVEFQGFRDRLAGDTPHELCQSCSLYKGTF